MGKCIVEMVDQYKVDILAIGIHPDDVELSCSGTLMKQISLGYKVAIVDLSQGELGSRGSGTLRLVEADNAAKVMGVLHRENLGMRDGFFAHTEDNILKIISIIRKYKPRIVLANAIMDRHPDHGRASKLISDACFMSGLIKVQTSFNGLNQDKWRPDNIYHYIQDYHLKPDFVIDISDFMDGKMESILSYKSQFYDPDSTAIATPISGQDFLDFVKAKAQVFGRNIGAKYAEGFTVQRELAVKDLCSLY